MNTNTFKKRPNGATLFMILLLSIMYGCDQISNPTSSLDLENSEMEFQMLSEVSGSETRISTSGTATQEVVYDNQMGDSVEVKATHPITNGNIIVKTVD